MSLWRRQPGRSRQLRAFVTGELRIGIEELARCLVFTNGLGGGWHRPGTDSPQRHSTPWPSDQPRTPRFTALWGEGC